MEAMAIIPDVTQVQFQAITDLLKARGVEDPNDLIGDGIELIGADRGGSISVGGYPQGTASGNPTVMICLEKDGQVWIAETTMALFVSAARALEARYGNV